MRSSLIQKKSLFCSGFLLFAGAALATAERTPIGDTPWRWTGQAGMLFQSESSLDSGGDMQVNRFFLEGGGSSVLPSGWRLGVSLGYGEDN